MKLNSKLFIALQFSRQNLRQTSPFHLDVLFQGVGKKDKKKRATAGMLLGISPFFFNVATNDELPGDVHARQSGRGSVRYKIPWPSRLATRWTKTPRGVDT